MSSYNCRKCQIKDRCIDQSPQDAGIKQMIRLAFEKGTDTQAAWRQLQQTCLLENAARTNGHAPARRPGTSALGMRLQQARAAKDAPADSFSSSKKFMARTTGYIGQEEYDAHYQKPGQRSQVTSKIQTRQLQKHLTARLHSRPLASSEVAAEPCWLTIEGSWRHIALPANGPIVLGAFDPGIGIPPDVDLAYEDKEPRLISRRHATVIGENGVHTVEDLGSISGVFLNEERLGLGPSRVLNPGDRIRLGNIQLIYDKVPAMLLASVKSSRVCHTLTVTSSGEKISLSPDQPVIIGRSDRRMNAVPDVDLRPAGEAARRVSRRHAAIRWRDGLPHVEDMGSGFGTRLRGEVLPLGTEVPLLPGDHIWLAGCVLAYEVEAVPSLLVDSQPVQPATHPPQEPGM